MSMGALTLVLEPTSNFTSRLFVKTVYSQSVGSEGVEVEVVVELTVDFGSHNIVRVRILVRCCLFRA